MKKIFLILLISILLTGCKKETINPSSIPTGSSGTVLQNEPQSIKCSVCGKEMCSEKFGCNIGVQLSTSINPQDKERKKFIQSQYGNYSIDKTYSICWEDWLKSLGVLPDEKKKIN